MSRNDHAGWLSQPSASDVQPDKSGWSQNAAMWSFIGQSKSACPRFTIILGPVMSLSLLSAREIMRLLRSTAVLSRSSVLRPYQLTIEKLLGKVSRAPAIDASMLSLPAPAMPMSVSSAPLPRPPPDLLVGNNMVGTAAHAIDREADPVANQVPAALLTDDRVKSSPFAKSDTEKPTLIANANERVRFVNYQGLAILLKYKKPTPLANTKRPAFLTDHKKPDHLADTKQSTLLATTNEDSPFANTQEPVLLPDDKEPSPLENTKPTASNSEHKYVYRMVIFRAGNEISYKHSATGTSDGDVHTDVDMHQVKNTKEEGALYWDIGTETSEVKRTAYKIIKNHDVEKYDISDIIIESEKREKLEKRYSKELEMDRMSFIPGAAAKQELFDAGGTITITGSSKQHVAIADEFILPCMRGNDTIVYQTALAALGDTDSLVINFGMRDPKPGEEMPSGEPPGATWVTFKDGTTGDSRTIWESGRLVEKLPDRHATRLFNAYRTALAAHQDCETPPPIELDSDEAAVSAAVPEDMKAMSRALAPPSLYWASSLMFCFVDVSPPPGHPQFDSEPDIVLTQPIRCYDALLVSALVALVWDRPPLVFGVMQHED
ncbi:hypothetical protein F5Y16DRAFT_395335 [Xylariaceae sp. FL0255]|nr:hypothetical protein F5Y16DRAFT_395335 [Xylariaceae sp. FL0255]